MNTDKICPMCGTTYGADHVFCPRDSSALRAAGDPDGLIGSVIGHRYLVTERIGAGGIGEVYKAQDVRLQRVVAVKVLRAHLAGDPDAVARVIREAANGSRIRNQYVVDISDYGETDEGRPYLAMEFVPGESLRAIIARDGRLEPHRVVSLLRQIAGGLDAAHRLGIVHRDMKPDNVLVYTGEGGAELVKVVDFGISRAIRDESQHLTKSGFITGTCEFMSPEQVTGRAFDHRTDIYALGLVTFMMLTGTLPFAGDTPELAMLVRLRESPRRLDQVDPSVRWPRELQDAIDRALALEAGSRFESAGEFARAVEHAVERSTEPRLAIPGRNIRWKGPATVTGAIAVAVVAAVLLYHPPRPVPPIEPPPTQNKIVPAPAETTAQESGEAPAPPAKTIVTPPQVPAARVTPHLSPQGQGRRPPTNTPAPGAAAAELDAYKHILQPEMSADSARQVIVALDGLLGRLTTKRDSVEADISRAEGYALAGDTVKACAILEAARPYANSLQRQKMELWVGEKLCQSPDWKAS
jgi:serine/threonine protein kinase